MFDAWPQAPAKSVCKVRTAAGSCLLLEMQPLACSRPSGDQGPLSPPWRLLKHSTLPAACTSNASQSHGVTPCPSYKACLDPSLTGVQLSTPPRRRCTSHPHMHALLLHITSHIRTSQQAVKECCHVLHTCIRGCRLKVQRPPAQRACAVQVVQSQQALHLRPRARASARTPISSFHPHSSLQGSTEQSGTSARAGLRAGRPGA